MKTLFKRTKTLLAIGFALFTTFTSLNANVFAAEENLIEYVNSNTKFSFQGPDNTTYEFSLVKLVEESALPNPSEKQIAAAKTIGVQFVETTKSNQTLSWESITVSQNGELTASEIEFKNYIELSKIITKQLITEKVQLKMYDFQYDGYIDVRDIVSLQNKYFSCPINFLIFNGNKMALDIFSSLLAEHKNNNEVVFKIYATDTPTIIETTSDEPVITTSSTPLETSMTSIITGDFSETESSITSPEELTVTSIITTTASTEETTTEPATTVNETTTAPEVTTLPETTVPVETTTENNTLPLDPEGWEIDQEIYDALVNSAELFGIDNYKIIWTEKEIINSIVYIDDWFAAVYLLQQQWAIQLCSIEELRATNKDFEIELGLNIDTFDIPNFVWRPIVNGDSQDQELSYNGYRCDIMFIENHIWKYLHWCLIPLDENGNEDLRIYNRPETTTTTLEETKSEETTTTTPEETKSEETTTTTPEETKSEETTTTTPEETKPEETTTTTPEETKSEETTATTSTEETNPPETTEPEESEPSETTPEKTVPPTIFDLEIPGKPGYYITQAELDSLVQGAEDFGIDRYKIIWTEEKIFGSVISTYDHNLGLYYLYNNFYGKIDEVRYVDREEFINHIIDISLIDPEDIYNDDILDRFNDTSENEYIYYEISQEMYDSGNYSLYRVHKGLDGKLYNWAPASPASGFMFPNFCLVPIT